ncbi:signal peptidase I [Georgenia sp. H159]|uniref:signal peptidase I n=1 Tax=Georgenia sp. H159 TaxID=3076115 RepID=UPI002D796C12|nr:signal peptidase I [Georgenia sp. H159]
MDTAHPDRWVRHTAAGVARTLLVTLAGLLLWSVLPAVLGWQPTVVMSGSMEPSIRTGDMVLTRDVPAGALRPGHVVLVDDPSRPGSRLMHRLVETDDDGGLVLRGDANEDPDSTPVAAADVRGVGIIRVPWVGLPYVWTAEGRYPSLAVTVLGLVALLALSPVRERTPPPDAGNDDATDDAPSSPPRAHSPGGRHAATAGAVTLLVGGVAIATGGVITPASAVFTDSTTMSATFTASTFPDSAATSTATIWDHSAGLEGQDDWYARSAVTVFIDAVAADGAQAGSITYRVNDGLPVTTPGSRAQVEVVGQGPNTVTYFATDGSGVREREKSVTVNLDLTPPTTVVESPTSTELTLEAWLATCAGQGGFCGTTSDGNGVGVARAEYTLMREDGLCLDGSAWTTDCTTQLPASLTGDRWSVAAPDPPLLQTPMTYTFQLRVTDLLEQTTHTTVTVRIT